MILTGHEIKKNIENGNIHISPFDESMLSTNIDKLKYRVKHENIVDSEDLREVIIDEMFIIYVNNEIIVNKINFTDEGYVLSPNKTYLANTYEEIGSDVFVPSLIGNSSLGRLGLFLQITADLGNLGAKHKWTLELKAIQPIKIYPMMKIGQVTFWKTFGSDEIKYQGKYDKFSVAKSSEIYKEFLK